MDIPVLTIIDALGTLPRAVESIIWNATHYNRGEKALGREIKIARPEDGSTTGAAACEYLHRFGVFTGVTHTQTDAFCFTVKDSQRDWAIALLQGAGYDVVSGTGGVKQTKPRYAWSDGPDTQNAAPPAKPEPKPEPKPGALERIRRELW